MAADGAEPARVEAGYRVGADAAHRDTTDRHPARISMQNLQSSRDHLVEHVGGPGGAGGVGPPGVVAVGEGDVRGARAKRVQRREHLAGELGIVVIAQAVQAVQEDQQRAVSTATRGRHEGQRHSALHEPTVDRQMPDPRPLRVHRHVHQRWRGAARKCPHGEGNGNERGRQTPAVFGEVSSDDRANDGHGRPPGKPGSSRRLVLLGSASVLPTSLISSGIAR